MDNTLPLLQRKLIVVCLSVIFMFPWAVVHGQEGNVLIRFNHIANGKSLVLRDSSYQTPTGETYTVTKLKYYVSHLRMTGPTETFIPESYHLIDAARTTEISCKMPVGSYTQIQFLLGVDSLANCSGAQTGALDPMNDMFWTWNSGYVFFKLEGRSPSSKADLQRIEQHIGGYKTANNAARLITLKYSDNKPISITEADTHIITITINLDRYWDAVQVIRLSETPVCMQPGPLALKISENFPALFSLDPRMAVQ